MINNSSKFFLLQSKFIEDNFIVMRFIRD